MCQCVVQLVTCKLDECNVSANKSDLSSNYKKTRQRNRGCTCLVAVVGFLFVLRYAFALCVICRPSSRTNIAAAFAASTISIVRANRACWHARCTRDSASNTIVACGVASIRHLGRRTRNAGQSRARSIHRRSIARIMSIRAFFTMSAICRRNSPRST